MYTSFLPLTDDKMEKEFKRIIIEGFENYEIGELYMAEDIAKKINDKFKEFIERLKKEANKVLTYDIKESWLDKLIDKLSGFEDEKHNTED